MIHTIMGCFGIAILALIALAFFGICLIVWNIYLRHQSVYEEEDTEEDDERNMEIYKNGLGRAAFLMHVSLFKMWKDNGESVIVGTLTDIQKEVSNNLGLILSSAVEDEKWEKMFSEYMKTSKDSPDISFGNDESDIG